MPGVIPLRELPVGAQFILLRTGQRFRLVDKRIEKGKTRYVVRPLGAGTPGTLNHQCCVRPIVKPHFKLRSKRP